MLDKEAPTGKLMPGWGGGDFETAFIEWTILYFTAWITPNQFAAY